MLQSKPSHLTFDQLKTKIENGNILIPQFQREFVWKKADAAKLLDSIVKGYPIGSFILWETKTALRSVKKIGGIELPKAKSGEYLYYVLDGQQRVTSLYAGMCGVKIGKDDYSQISIDLEADENQEIVICDSEHYNEEKIISINELLRGKPQDIVKKYLEDDVTKIFDYKEKFTTYQFPIIEITEANLDTATDIFTRINVTGKGLDTFEIMCAKTYDEEQSFDLFEKREKQKELWKESNYDSIPNSTVLQAISICINGGCSKKHILNNITKQQFIDTWSKIDDGFSNAIDYMKTAFGIPVSNLLPYHGLMVPFVYYFFKHPKQPSAAENNLLKDYFWRCALTNRFSDGLESKLSQDIENVIDNILSGKEPKYEQGVDITFDFIKRNGTFSTGNALIKGILCLLVAQKPKSFKNNNEVIVDNDWLSQSNSKNYHHFFPKNYMKRKLGFLYNENLVNHIANITIVDSQLNKAEIKDKAPSEYMKTYYDGNRSEISETMRTHFIGDFNEYGIWEDNYSKFFDKRLHAIVDALKNEIIVRNDIDNYDGKKFD